MLLLERIRPGDTLVTLVDDTRATHIAAALMLTLRRPARADSRLVPLREWFDGFARLRAGFQGGTGPLDQALVGRADAAAREFFAEQDEPVLMHGDLHHFNILSSDRGWLAIDPKGVVGPAAYEVGPFLINPWIVSGMPPDASRLMQTRVNILCECLGFEKARIQGWGLAHAVLSSLWSLEAGQDWRPAMQCARLLAS
jgi:streptomycin 6-kinase